MQYARLDGPHVLSSRVLLRFLSFNEFGFRIIITICVVFTVPMELLFKYSCSVDLFFYIPHRLSGVAIKNKCFEEKKITELK